MVSSGPDKFQKIIWLFAHDIAQKYIYIQSPYLYLMKVMDALKILFIRIDVRIMVPNKPELFAYWATYSFIG